MNALIGGKRLRHGREARALLGSGREAPDRDMSQSAEAQKGWNPLRTLYAWVMRHAEGPNAWAVLAALSFAESSFFPMPPDVLMIPMILANRRRAFAIGAWTALWSVIGGLLGYALGSLLYNSVGKWLIEVYGMGGDIASFQATFVKCGPLIVLQGMTPIPFKLITIASGFAHLPLLLFVTLSTITRTFRFMAVATVLYAMGDRARVFVERFLPIILLVLLVIVVGGFFVARTIFHGAAGGFSVCNFH
jgi:membrane protein YqaA with SNARE-associated domain